MIDEIPNLLDFDTYLFFENTAPYLIFWVNLFLIFSLGKIVVQIFTEKKFRYRGIISELPGLPLTLMHTVCWVRFVYHGDLFSSLLFLWWGPGFLISAYLFLFKKNFNWLSLGKITSMACKLCYVMLMIIFFLLDSPQLIFVFSVWIITDQINLIQFEKNADRSRRFVEDKWIFRICYPLFLFIPFVYETQFNGYFRILGVTVFIVWIITLVGIIRDGKFHDKPSSYKEFLRNIIYGK